LKSIDQCEQGLVAKLQTDFTKKLENIAVKLTSNENAGTEINNKISVLLANLLAKIKEQVI